MVVDTIIAVLLEGSADETNWFHGYTWIQWLFIAAALYTFGIPLLILRMFRLESRPTLIPLDLEDPETPTSLHQHLEPLKDELAELGFLFLECFFLPKTVNNVQSIVGFFVNRTTNDIVLAVTSYGLLHDEWKAKKTYLEFSSNYRDGFEINTGNSKDSSSFPSVSHILTMHLPWVNDVSELYHIHQEICALKKPTRQKILTVDTKFAGDAREDLAYSMQEEMVRAADSGYLKLSEDGKNYLATMKGGYLMTWKQLPPIKQVVDCLRHRSNRRLLTEIGYPKRG